MLKRTVSVLVAVLAVIILSMSAIYVTRQATREVSTTTSTSVTTSVTTTATKTSTVQPVQRTYLGAKVASVSYGQINTATEGSIMEELNGLKELGVETYSIHLNYDPYLKNDAVRIALYDYTVNIIKSWGKTLVITDAAAESYRKNRLSWTEFKEAFRKRVTNIAERYKPDYYVPIKESLFYEEGHIKESDVPRPLQEWVDLQEELSVIVKEKSPSTKTAIALVAQLKHDQDLLMLVRDLPNLDVIGFDVYGGKLLVNDMNRLYVIESLLPFARNKEVMILETWAQGALKLSTPDPKLEAEWVKNAICLAKEHNIKTVIFFHLSERMNIPEVREAVLKAQC